MIYEIHVVCIYNMCVRGDVASGIQGCRAITL